jgi:hypothetical protein
MLAGEALTHTWCIGGSQSMPGSSHVRAIGTSEIQRHRSIEVTCRIYRRLMPSAWDRARTALDQAYLESMFAGPC